MPKKILLIEDNPDHALITKRALNAADSDYQMDFVNDGRAGLEKAISQNYDLILCDYRLPGLSALDILKRMIEKAKDTPFVVITSAGSEQIAVEVMKNGAYDYIIKDTSYEDILPMVVKSSLERYSEKKAKEAAEQELKEAYIKLKETQNQLIQAEKMEAIGRMASGVAHEVKNPLGIVLQGVDYLANNIPEGNKETIKVVQAIKKSIKRADDIIRALLDFTRGGELKIDRGDINAVLEESLDLLRHNFKVKNIEVVEELGSALPAILIDNAKMMQVFINIFRNAVDAMPDGGTLNIRSYQVKLDKVGFRIGRRGGEDYFSPGETAVVVEIEDTGIGISKENLNKIFDAFFTTKGPRDGAGLGLSIVKSIIDMHRGIVTIESKEGKGTKIAITLKIA